jgi:hypothetical protein
MSALAAVLALALTAAPRERPASPPTDAPVAPAGSQASPLPGGDSPWRFALSSGVAGKLGGRRISAGKENPSLLLFVGGQAEGARAEGRGQAARLRFRLFAGGESDLWVPSDGEAELAWMVGRRQFRFVLARVEVARYPGLALQTLTQAGTLPCFEGAVSFAGDAMELAYFVSPVEAAWVRYYGSAHVTRLPGWTPEDDRASAASAARLRYTLLLERALAATIQADFVKLWGKADVLLGLEGAVAYQLLDQGASFQLAARWGDYTRRGRGRDTEENDAEVMLVGSASLSF